MRHFDHQHAITLEHLVRGVYGLEHRGGMGGMIDADHFNRHPFDAALLALAPYYYKNHDIPGVSAFLDKYSVMFDAADDIGDWDGLIHQYIEELRAIIKTARGEEN